MPDFLAGLITVATFCLGLIGLNLLTRTGQLLVPLELAEDGLLQYGGALALARLAWCRAVQNRAGVVNE